MDENQFKNLVAGSNLLHSMGNEKVRQQIKSAEYPNLQESIGALVNFSQNYGTGAFAEAYKDYQTNKLSLEDALFQMYRAGSERLKLTNSITIFSLLTHMELSETEKQLLNELTSEPDPHKQKDAIDHLVSGLSGKHASSGAYPAGTHQGHTTSSTTQEITPEIPNPANSTTARLQRYQDLRANTQTQPRVGKTFTPTTNQTQTNPQATPNTRNARLQRYRTLSGRSPSGPIKPTPLPHSATMQQPVSIFNDDSTAEQRDNRNRVNRFVQTRFKSNNPIVRGASTVLGKVGGGISEIAMPGSGSTSRPSFSLPSGMGAQASNFGRAARNAGVSNLTRGGRALARAGKAGKAGKAAGVASNTAKIARLATLLFNPVTIGIIVVLVLGGLMFFYFQRVNAWCGLPWLNRCVGGYSAADTVPIANIKVTKRAPARSDITSPITYDITASYLGYGTATLEVRDPIPENTVFVSASDGTDPQSCTINGRTYPNCMVWRIENIGYGEEARFSFTVSPTTEVWVQNTVHLTLLNSTFAGVAPNADNCGGRYVLNNPLGNFGDPNCNFDPTELYQLLRQLDPNDADYWYNTVVRCESGYVPNAFADPIRVGTPDSAGAWGLFQMGRGRNGQFDHGDVEWHLQTSNAVNYQNTLLEPIGLKWRYWQCARSRW